MRHGDSVTCEWPLRHLHPRDTGVTEHTGTEPALAMSPAHAARAASPCEGPGTQTPVSEGQGYGQALSASTVLRLPQTASECPAFGVGGARGVHQCSQCSARNPKHSQHYQCVPFPPNPSPHQGQPRSTQGGWRAQGHRDTDAEPALVQCWCLFV